MMVREQISRQFRARNLRPRYRSHPNIRDIIHDEISGLKQIDIYTEIIIIINHLTLIAIHVYHI